jgi:hypothetical protein
MNIKTGHWVSKVTTFGDFLVGGADVAIAIYFVSPDAHRLDSMYLSLQIGN